MPWPDNPNDDSFVVIDQGSYATKAGFADPLNPPTLEIPSYLSRKIVDGRSDKSFSKESFGDTGIYQHGIVSNWEDVEALWTHILQNELRISRMEETPVLVTERSCAPKEDRERIAQYMFEEAQTPALFIGEQPLMCMYSCGILTGLVIDVGHTKTDITPIIDGIIQRNAMQSVPLGGQHVDSQLFELMKEDPAVPEEVRATLDMRNVRFVKEAAGATCRRGRATGSFPPFPVRLENGVTFNLAETRFNATEPLFSPVEFGIEELGIQDYARCAITSCEPERRKTMTESILLTGGSSRFDGFAERLQHEIGSYLPISDLMSEGVPPVQQVRFLKTPDYLRSFRKRPDLASWFGASIVAKLVFSQPQQQQFITRAEYNETGPTIVHTKFF